MNLPNLIIDILHSENAFISLDGKYFFGETQRRLSGDWSMYVKDDKIYLENDKEIIIADDHTIFSPQEWSDSYFIIKESGSVVSEKNYFKGAIEVALSDGEIVVSNRVDVDFFVSSLMDKHFAHNKELEFLKVMAIVYRSYFLKYNKELNETSLIKDGKLGEQLLFVKNLISPNPQQLKFLYKGISLVGNELSRQAVEETKGLALFCNSQIVALPYTYCCGGITESGFYRGNDILSNNLNSRMDYSVEKEILFSSENEVKEWIYKPADSYCGTKNEGVLNTLISEYIGDRKQLFRWNQRVEEQTLIEVLQSILNKNISEVTEILIKERSDVGTIIKLEIQSAGEKLVLEKYDLLYFASLLDLPSLTFLISESSKDNKGKKVFNFNGAGRGHRAGVCMLGAMALSEQGKTMQDIVHHYYKDIYIAKQY